MIINSESSNGQTFYTFSKGRFSYEATRATHPKSWEIWTTDSSKTFPHNRTCKVMYESEMKAKIWQGFFSIVNCEPLAV